MKLLALNLRSLVLAAGLVVAGLGLGATGAQASDYCPTYRYEWVQRCEYRQVPYTVCITRYDHCGYAYTVHVTRYRSESYTVWRQVRVAY